MFRVVGAGSVALAWVAVAACSANATPSQHEADKVRSVPAFHAVDVNGVIKVELTIGKPDPLRLLADNSVLPQIGTKVANGRLQLTLAASSSYRETPTVVIRTPTLDAFTADGGAHATIAGVAGKSLSLSLGGPSRITVAGTVDQAHIDAVGAGAIDASNLRAKQVIVRLHGSAEVQVDATAALDASIKGPGEVLYAGNPAKVKKSVWGSGRLVAD